MKIKIGKLVVDVLDADCADRPCYRFGYDKGSFTPGRGYTRYHTVERPVCMTRHLHGCPANSVCPTCRTVTVLDVGSRCQRPGCGGTTVEITAEVPHD